MAPPGAIFILLNLQMHFAKSLCFVVVDALVAGRFLLG
jgi:hypothetical protein